ncbi:MAG: methyltransferase domain-containing protein [Hyphomicrobiaceae bacterium]
MSNAAGSKTLVQQQFGANAAHYVTSPTHATGASLARVVELAGPKKDWHALDIATGAGHMALAFAPRVAEVIASDLTPQMIAQAASLAAERGLSNVRTAIADSEALPFEDGQFDLVSCRIAPHHFTDIPRFVAEAWRVLKPNGTFALVDNISPDATTSPGFSEEELAAADVRYNLFEKIRDPSHGRALTAAAWRGLLAEAGFVIAHQELMTKSMAFRTWCNNMAVPPDVERRIEDMLEHAGACLGAFLRSRTEADGERAFSLHELVLIARKPT